MAVAVDQLDGVLDSTWKAISETYDVSASRPDLQCLFSGCSLHDPVDAAECVLLNMLIEAMEQVSRFSRWYTMPARAFGVMRFCEAGRVRWILAPDAVQRWQLEVEELSSVIRRDKALLEAELLVDRLLSEPEAGAPCVLAACQCVPQRSILINEAVLSSTDIVCSECHHPFRPVG